MKKIADKVLICIGIITLIQPIFYGYNLLTTATIFFWIMYLFLREENE